MTKLARKSLCVPRNSLCILGTLMLAMAVLSANAANAADPVVPFNGKTLDGWKAKGPLDQAKWSVGIAKIDPANPNRLAATPQGDKPGELITLQGHGSDLYTTEKFGDCTIELEVMVPKGSNSGIYLMGEYEIQVLDSYGREKIGPGDMGGIYGAKPAKVNASKKPGEWQKYVIEFVAPRFKDGKKVANARFVKVTLNGKVIHENVEMANKTPGGVAGREAATGPLMFQGNHGAVAFRNIKITSPKKK